MASPAAQAPLMPSLYAILSPSFHQTLVSQLSLMAIHSEPYHIQDDMFISTLGQGSTERTLRFRTQTESPPNVTPRQSRINGEIEMNGDLKGKGKGKALDEFPKYSLAYVSPALSGREYGEMNVRAVLGMDVTGMSDRDEIWDFVECLGLRHSHSYTRSGLLFYIPLPHPAFTLRLTITHLIPVDNPSPKTAPSESELGRAPPAQAEFSTKSSKPYIVQLSPSRSVQTVPPRGEPSLVDIMNMMRDVAGRVDMLDWGTGRE
ncbi:hypothetical protein BD324DRAFT_312530 [Kockovaella imperatae]|uniref:Mediator of RNA polymerase II transcription subunit 18 n=1 Tax=Kockovaella imperatae TaxID=4999 RepID=A0A1Y1UMA9_9TREE|nr:hypothetical protein BD324DRAFT_312530 [Kockovaella imperatae]ORX39139.1 hypothetical protein BD324DRAFT_312530 [Kockovaella imperatae]